MGGNVSPLGERETWMQAVSLLYPRVNHITPLSTAVWLNELVRLWWGQRRAPWVWCVLLTDVVTMDDMTCLLWDSWEEFPQVIFFFFLRRRKKERDARQKYYLCSFGGWLSVHHLWACLSHLRTEWREKNS